VSGAQLEIQLVAVVVAVACALPGSFLVLRRMAMMSDAISHSILPGIVVGFLLTGDLGSPWLVGGAAATGLLTVALVESIQRTGLVREDAAIGIVFPVLFSAGVILIAVYAGDVHLDMDAVLLGELAFAPFDRFTAGGTDLGPRSLWIMGGLLVIDAAFIVAFFKELKLATFDAGLAAALGFMPGLLHYGLMGLVSLTAVGAFDAVGSILVVALMVGPPATAWLLTDRLPVMLPLAAGIGALSAVGGYWMARALDASIGGSMATAVGIAFALSALFAPGRGLVAGARRRSRQRWTFAERMLAVHLLTHEGSPEAERECRPEHLQEHLRWDGTFATAVVRRAIGSGLVRRSGPVLELTPAGREFAGRSITEL
jgi:manganese/zinc/iron transport system permease protein